MHQIQQWERWRICNGAQKPQKIWHPRFVQHTSQKVNSWDYEKEYHKSDVPDSSGCETSNHNICDHWNRKHTLSPLNTRWYIRIWQEVLSNSTISGDFKMCQWMSKKKNCNDFNLKRTSCSQDHEERNCGNEIVLIPHQEAAPKNNWVTTNNLDIH